MKTRSVTTLLAALTAAAFWTTPVIAQPDHGHKDGDHAHGDVAKAKTFAEAARRIADEVKAIEASLKGGSVAGVSDRANAVNALAKDLGALSLAKDSGIPREKVKDANLAGKELAEAAEALHEIADKGDVAKSTAAFAAVKAAAAKIEAVAPATYYCPMHCEGGKTYAAPGECPVCHMKLKKQTSEQFTMDIKPIGGGGGGTITAGKPVNLLFTIKDPRGMMVKTVEIVHEQPLHLLMVSKDLSWYAHEHPVLQPDGTFTFTWTFPAGGEYTLFNDFTPKDVGMQVVPVTLKVEGTPAAAVALKADSDKPKTVDGYTVTLNTGGPVTTGKPTTMSYTIAKDGKPVNDLTPYLGAMGHLVIMSQDLKEFVHSHPHEHAEGDKGGHDHAKQGHTDMKGGPKVDFEAHFKAAGLYKGWAQFQHNGKVITVPFTFNVAKGDGKDAAPDGHKHGAKPVNGTCPITREVADAAITRDFKGQLVGFHDAASATAWDGLKDEERLTKFVAALAAGTPAGHDDGMPDGLADAEARELYLTPGGLYTEADIKANGSVTADAKFKGVMSKHDFKPKAGDAICPITLTKVNPKFTWIIGGKTYQFCCPPCIDEFVLLAKESPDEIKDPSFYVKK